MDAVFLSRLQFAVATLFHFLFVPLTLGLSVMVAVMESRWVATGQEIYKRMARFWGKLLVINFALGVVTGITLEFQFGTNWAGYSRYVGDVFGPLLAVEATVAFFLESTFLGVWIFGWDRLSPKVHALSIWLVAIASNVSAFWILTANAWMQHPVGYVIRGGRAELADFWAVITQPMAWVEFMHTVAGGWLVAAFFVMGVSAWHLLRGREGEFFSRSFRLALAFAVVLSLFEVVQGHLNGATVAAHQPAKLAAMESHWQTTKAAPIYLFAWPDEQAERNAVEIGKLPGALSMLAYHDPTAEVKGLKDFPPADRPPVLPTFVSFRVMVGIGFALVVLSLWGLAVRKRLASARGYLRIMTWAIVLPYIACEAGWIVAEVGRQPWIVWGLMRTSEAASPVGAASVAVSLWAFILVYSLLGAIAVWLMFRYARKGPEPAGKGGY